MFSELIIIYKNNGIELFDLIGIKFLKSISISSYFNPFIEYGGLAIILSNFLFNGYLILSP